MFVLPGYSILHHVILDVYFGLLTGILGLTISFIARRRNYAMALFVAPFWWVLYEFLRSNLSFLALPWGLLAHTQYRHPVVIQLASLTGVYGVSFLIVLVNAALTGLLLWCFALWKKKSGRAAAEPSTHGAFLLAAVAVALLSFSLLFGYLEGKREISGERIKIALIQGNIAQREKWDAAYAQEIMKIYTSLSQEAAAAKPILIVWPETATPRSITVDPKIYQQVTRVAASTGAYLLLGSAQAQKFNVKDPGKSQYMNSAFLIPPQFGNAKPERYDKIRLLPFGEFLPYRDQIPWALIGIPDIREYLPGKEYHLLTLAEHRFAAPICWENIFPSMGRIFVCNGAEFIINITNEAWFGKTAAPYQFLSMNVFRAAENRRYVLRCANTGISCIIDPYGRILSRVADDNGNDLFVRGYLTGYLTPLKAKTVYTRYGEWFVWLCASVSAILVLVSLFRFKTFTPTVTASPTDE
jgi:apolipoprotein N-acyltransferase